MKLDNIAIGCKVVMKSEDSMMRSPYFSYSTSEEGLTLHFKKGIRYCRKYDSKYLGKSLVVVRVVGDNIIYSTPEGNGALSRHAFKKYEGVGKNE